MNLAQSIAQMREEKTAKLAARNEMADALNVLRSAETPDATKIEESRAAKAAIDKELDELEVNLSRAEAELARDDAAARAADALPGKESEKPGYDQVGRVGQEPRTYTEIKDKRGEARFFADAFNAQRGNIQAQERIARHGQEVTVEREMSERALATGGIAGLTIPQYLVDMAAPVLRAGRPLANVCNRHELPDEGMSLVVPRGTTGASAAAQATENTAVSSTDEVWANLTVPVCTVAGQQQVSRQSLERGSSMDAIIFQDLARAHGAQVDNYIINGSGASGQPLGILNTAGIGAATAFGAVPGAANSSLKVAGAVYNVTSAGAGIYPKTLVMHPRRWAWFTGLVDGSNRPVVEVANTGLFNALAQILAPGQISADAASGSQYVGTHNSGLPILTDLNIPTNVGTNSEDVILALDLQEQHLWEDGDGMPRQLTFEQTAGNNLTTTLVVYSYMAFTAGRYPGAAAKVGGVDSTATFGLVSPSF
jgi:HK97 family phage major capsid protein